MKKSVLVFLTILTTHLGACSKGPKHAQVLEDWQKLCERDNSRADYKCTEYVRFTRPAQVIESKVVNDTEATALVEIHGDWIGSGMDPGFWSGPCSGFKKQHGNNQGVIREATYVKTSDGWRLVDRLKVDGGSFLVKRTFHPGDGAKGEKSKEATDDNHVTSDATWGDWLQKQVSREAISPKEKQKLLLAPANLRTSIMQKIERRQWSREAVINIERLADAIKSLYKNKKVWPRSCAWTPSDICFQKSADECKDGRKCRGELGFWQTSPWVDLDFAIEEDHRYQYRIEASPERVDEVKIFARGDLDCDGTFSSFEMRGNKDADGLVRFVGPIIDGEIE